MTIMFYEQVNHIKAVAMYLDIFLPDIMSRSLDQRGWCASARTVLWDVCVPSWRVPSSDCGGTDGRSNRDEAQPFNQGIWCEMLCRSVHTLIKIHVLSFIADHSNLKP